MTDQTESNEQIPELHAVVEAFLDGEMVDPSMLGAALADESARDHFVDLLVIRRGVHGLDALTTSTVHRPQGTWPRKKWLAAAAAAVVVSVSAGYVAGQRALAATIVPSTVEAFVFPDDEPAAPKPTRSITLKPGVNWTDNSGGR